jgi:ABC-type Mn2+/Zn2+ transport system permease subunit
MYGCRTLSTFHPIPFCVLSAAFGPFQRALFTTAAMCTACAVLSVIVVLRRWAFIGEGISHAGFGGIGTGWLLSLVFPALGRPGAVYAAAILFCLAMAVCIGYVTRERTEREAFGPDSAIGIFLVASLAWGFMALAIYNRRVPTGSAESWERYLFGSISHVSTDAMLAGVAVSAAVVFAVASVFKEIVYYAFDPLMAQVSGVRVGAIHYLLMLLLAMTIVIGMRIAGNVLVTALLVLPGATALLLSRRLGAVMTISVIVGVTGGVGGLMVNRALWPFLPSGPAMVMVLFVEFVAAYAWSRIPRRVRVRMG